MLRHPIRNIHVTTSHSWRHAEPSGRKPITRGAIQTHYSTPKHRKRSPSHAEPSRTDAYFALNHLERIRSHVEPTWNFWGIRFVSRISDLLQIFRFLPEFGILQETGLSRWFSLSPWLPQGFAFSRFGYRASDSRHDPALATFKIHAMIQTSSFSIFY